MSLFSKKEPVNTAVSVVFYCGELPGFTTNVPCKVQLTGQLLTVSRVKPEVQANLISTSIDGIELYYKEADYMMRYHGQADSTSKLHGTEKMYFVINYRKEDTTTVRLAFWCTVFEMKKIAKMSQALSVAMKPVAYTL